MADHLKASYGIPKDAGGDSPENVSRMERCVTKFQNSGKSQESAIRICKISLFGSALGASQVEILKAKAEVLKAAGPLASNENRDAIEKCITTLQDILSMLIPGEYDQPIQNVKFGGQGAMFSKKNLDTLKQCCSMLQDMVDMMEPVDISTPYKNASAQTVSIEGENLVITEVAAAQWTTAFMNNLPDSSFAVIEPGGTKDSEGKTEPRSLRHLPYKDASGVVDLPHLRNALARLNQTKLSTALKDKARTVLEKAAKSKGVGASASGSTYPLTNEIQVSLTAGERLGTYLQRARQAKYLSCDQLAEQLPIGCAAYVAIENGYNISPPDDILQALSDALGVDVAELQKLATLDQEDPVMTFY